MSRNKPRGLSSIRTMTLKSRNQNAPHQLYLRIAAFEMERTRLLAERDAALSRLASIAERSQELDREIAHLHDRIESIQDRPRRTRSEPSSASSNERASFPIRY
ncbi:MAG: hypothetical protein AAFS10_23920 [Myxococcota bacterium]